MKRPRLEALKRQWEEKLKQSGFEDAEKEIGGERVLRQSADYAYRRKEQTPEIRAIKLSYFMLLAQRISEETEFEDKFDKLIMERTAEGLSATRIAEEVRAIMWIEAGLPWQKKKRRGSANRKTIRMIRRRYETRWGIRIWTARQMRKVPTR